MRLSRVMAEPCLTTVASVRESVLSRVEPPQTLLTTALSAAAALGRGGGRALPDNGAETLQA
jgi:hypothetical protein